ncbi:hypothetical protein CFOL_v3_10490 [Cephalotus follicularis]|uniref:Uncharacterized protein n=1 Tax=Cephalotus follicularis TaxID=3775 RepID=A0A1Q3BG58_CEPFO|nr:hypothetical protein CFOL_v3_10490 [Cephalotus follicularis]
MIRTRKMTILWDGNTLVQTIMPMDKLMKKVEIIHQLRQVVRTHDRSHVICALGQSHLVVCERGKSGLWVTVLPPHSYWDLILLIAELYKCLRFKHKMRSYQAICRSWRQR